MSGSGWSLQSRGSAFVRSLDALPQAWRILSLGLVVLAALLVRMPYLGAAGYTDDTNIFLRWLESALQYPPDQLYQRDPSINYPPAYAAILELTARAYRLLPHAGHDVALMRTLVKLPAILFDLAGVLVAFALVRRFASYSLALAAAAFFAFNPAIVYISAYWGQLDSVPTVLALAAVLLLFSGRALLAWPVLALAVLVKPPVLLLAPLFLIYAFAAPNAVERNRRLLGAAAGLGLALVLTEALAFAFFPHPTPLAPTQLLAAKLHQGSSLYEVNSLNAFNVWALFGDFFASDRTHWGPLIMKHWAQALFLAVAAAICWVYARRRSPVALLEAAVLMFLAFFLFMPEMHERYEIYATAFAGVTLFRRPYAVAAAVLSLTTILSLEYALTYMYLVDAHVTAVHVNEFAPWLVRTCALANLAVFVWLGAAYVSRQPD